MTKQQLRRADVFNPADYASYERWVSRDPTRRSPVLAGGQAIARAVNVALRYVASPDAQEANDVI